MTYEDDDPLYNVKLSNAKIFNLYETKNQLLRTLDVEYKLK